MAINMGTAIAYLELDTSQFQKGFKSAISDLSVFQDKSATTGQKLQGLSSSMVTVGSMLSKKVTVPLVALGTAALKVSSDFNAGMSEVKAISGATGTDFDKLKAKAIEMGAKTKYSASESAQAMKYMAMAGWDAQDMISGISGVMDLAAASGEDLASVSDIVTDALTAFGLQASDSSHFADVLAQASARSNTNVGLLGETFKYVAPVAGALGYSVEDCAVAIGVMANNGIKGSQAGTAMRSMLTRLAKPTDQVADAMKRYNISMTDANGNMKPLSTLLGEMRDRFSKLSEAEKAQLAATLAGQEGMSGLLAIVNTSDTDFQNLTNSINNADGAASKMAKTMQDNLKGDFTILKSNAESAAIAIGDKLEPSMRKIVKTATSVVESFNDMSDAEQSQIVKVGAMAAAFPVAMLAGGKFLGMLAGGVKTINTVTKETQLFVKALNMYRFGQTTAAFQASSWLNTLSKTGTAISTFVTSPLGAATLAIGAFVVACKLQDKQMNDARKSASKLSEQEKVLHDSIQDLSDSYNDLESARRDGISSAQQENELQQSLWEKLQSVVDENGRVLAGKETYAQFIAGELSDALGQEVSIVDGQVQAYDELKGSIEHVMQTKKANAILQASEQEYTEALKSQSTAVQNYNDALSAVNETQATLKTKQKNYNDALKEYNDLVSKGVQPNNAMRNHLMELKGDLEGTSDKLKKQKSDLKNAQDAMVGYNQTIENYEGLGAAIISGDADKIEEALLRTQESFQTANTGTRESLEEQSKNITEKYNQMKEALANGQQGVTQEYVDQLKDLAGRANEELVTRIDQDKEILTNKFKAVGIEVPQSLINELYNKSPEVLQGVTDVLANMSNGVQLKQDEIKTLFNQLGIDAPTDLISQLASLQPDVQRQAIDLVTELQNGESVKRGEILQQMRDLGIKIDDSTAEGIGANETTVKNKAGGVGQTAHDEMDSKTSKTLKSPDVDDNIVSSAESQAESARSSAQSILDNPVSMVVNIVKNIVEDISGHHANGLDYVPYNGYVAELHEGERVLTKQQNKDYNTGRTNSGGDIFNFYNTRPEPYEYARQMKKAKRELMLGM